MTSRLAAEKTREERVASALDRIARFAEAYDIAVSERSYRNENVGSALCVTLGRYARRVLENV